MRRMDGDLNPQVLGSNPRGRTTKNVHHQEGQFRALTTPHSWRVDAVQGAVRILGCRWRVAVQHCFGGAGDFLKAAPDAAGVNARNAHGVSPQIRQTCAVGVSSRRGRELRDSIGLSSPRGVASGEYHPSG